MAEALTAESLVLKRVMGFDGSVREGLHCHPNRRDLVYSLGSHLIIEEVDKSGDCNQTVLTEHLGKITCLDVSASGKYLASGHYAHNGILAPAVLWDFDAKQSLRSLLLHNGKVEALCFTLNDEFLITMGGLEDGAVIVWKVDTGTVFCGCPTRIGNAGVCLKSSTIYDNIFVTSECNNLRVWTLDVANRRIRPEQIRLPRSMHRVIKCLVICDYECPHYCLCGTLTGDILVADMDSLRVVATTPPNKLLYLGVTALAKVRGINITYGVKSDGTSITLPYLHVLVGSGDGCLAIYTLSLVPRDRKLRKLKVNFIKHMWADVWRDVFGVGRPFPVASIALHGDGEQFFVGCSNSPMYRFRLCDFAYEVLRTCQFKRVNDIVFPNNCTELFVTCQEEEVRVWATKTGQELKRYVVWNVNCTCIALTKDGCTIYSGWSDGRIRVLGFVRGLSQLLRGGDLFQKFCIRDVDPTGVTAIAVTSDAHYVISGGGGGAIKIWEISRGGDPKTRHLPRETMVADLNEHKSAVCCIRMNKNDTECTSASVDGTTVIWDIIKRTCLRMVVARAGLRSLVCGKDFRHILTTGTDRHIVFWESASGRCVREVLGARDGAINSLDMSRDGRLLVSGGDEQIVKMWSYIKGEISHMGLGHDVPIAVVRISPNVALILSVGEDGAIFVWEVPEHLQRKVHWA